MSSTSTNKQPLLVDRPLHKWAALGTTPALSSSTNYTSVLGGGCAELVNCISTDGAVIDSVSIVTPQASTTSVVVILFLSTASTTSAISESNTVPVAAASVGTTAGERVNISLPPLTVPVPSVGGQTAPTEVSKKNTGLLIESGQVLYVGINTQVLAPTPATKVLVFAQGGFY